MGGKRKGQRSSQFGSTLLLASSPTKMERDLELTADDLHHNSLQIHSPLQRTLQDILDRLVDELLSDGRRDMSTPRFRCFPDQIYAGKGDERWRDVSVDVDLRAQTEAK